MVANKVFITKETKLNPPQVEDMNSRPPREFTPLIESLHDILKKICDHHMITLLEIRPEWANDKNSKWYNENEYYHNHHQKGHWINKCRMLQHKIQNLIDQWKLEVDNHVAPSNQNLRIYQNPLSQYEANNVSLLYKKK